MTWGDFPSEQLTYAAANPGTAAVTNARILRSADLGPCAAFLSVKTDGGGCGAFGCVSVYLERVRLQPGAVPALNWELRARHSGTSQSEPIPGASGSLSKWAAYETEGSIVHVSGHLALGYELWMRASGAGDRMFCDVRFVFGPPACGPYLVTPGALV